MLGLICISVVKTFALTQPDLNNETYITEVISISCIFNAMRALWSIWLDHSTYKTVYGFMIGLETFLGLTYFFSSKSKVSYAIWIWLNQWCEGASFALMPNVLKSIYGKHATELYGYLFSFNATASLIFLAMSRSPLGTMYYWMYGIGSTCSILAGVLLFTKFDPTPFKERRIAQNQRISSVKISEIDE